MKQEYKSLFSIVHDHFLSSMIAQIIKRGSSKIEGMPNTTEEKAKYTIHFYDQELENHFYLEENILQPEIKGISKEIDKLLDDMVKQHREIEALVKSLKNNKGLVNKLDKLGKALEGHISMEERVLFPKIQETLSVNDLEVLAKKLQSNGYEFIYKYK
jgi:iron-sulfur cluster repair protein YtfE (RIC family)